MLLSLWASQPRQPTGNTEPRIHPRCTLPGLLGLLGPPSLCGLQHLSVEGDPFPWRFVCPVKKSSLHSGPSLGTSPSLSGQYPGTASSSVRFHVSLNLFYSTSLSVFVRLLLLQLQTSANRLSITHFSKVLTVQSFRLEDPRLSL